VCATALAVRIKIGDQKERDGYNDRQINRNSSPLRRSL
jgi:hypothetical protein